VCKHEARKFNVIGKRHASYISPETRGRANAFLGVIDDLGKGFGPFFLSQLITAFGRRLAFNVSLIGWLIGGLIYFFLYFTIKRDKDNVQNTIRSRIQM
jgi:hypothetical protein